MKNRNNIFLIGPMGAGKTTIGKPLSLLFNFSFFDSDAEIERCTGVSISWIFEIEQEYGFRLREKQMISDLTQREGIILATGGGVVETPENCKLLAERGVVIYLTVSVEEQLKRIRYGKETRPLLNCSNPRERLQQLNQKRDPLYRAIADLIYETHKFSPHKLALQIHQDVIRLKAKE